MWPFGKPSSVQPGVDQPLIGQVQINLLPSPQLIQVKQSGNYQFNVSLAGPWGANSQVLPVVFQFPQKFSLRYFSGSVMTYTTATGVATAWPAFRMYLYYTNAAQAKSIRLPLFNDTQNNTITMPGQYDLQRADLAGTSQFGNVKKEWPEGHLIYTPGIQCGWACVFYYAVSAAETVDITSEFGFY